MLEKQSSRSSKAIRKGSILENIYSSLDKEAKAGYLQLWMGHFNMPRDSFRRRAKTRELEETALMFYYLKKSEGETSPLIEYYRENFRNTDGTPYSTLLKMRDIA